MDAFGACWEERKNEAKRLWSLRDCCLDQGVGAKLRKMFPEEDGWKKLFEPDLQAFLDMLYCRCVLSTSMVECTFACFRRWVLKGSSRLGIDNIGSRHYLQSFLRAWERMNPGKKCGQTARGTTRKRPAWVAKSRTFAGYGRNTTCRDVFSGST